MGYNILRNSLGKPQINHEICIPDFMLDSQGAGPYIDFSFQYHIHDNRQHQLPAPKETAGMTHHSDTAVLTYVGRCCPPGVPAAKKTAQQTTTGCGVFSAGATDVFRSTHLSDENQNR
jgi:hypothetical protein